MNARKEAKKFAKENGIKLENGYLLYEGPSMLEPDTMIAAIVTGFVRPSKNEKNGDVLQVSYTVKDLHPQDAIDSGKDCAVCGDCPFRKENSPVYKGKKRRLCYVNMNSIFSISKKYNSGGYKPLPSEELLKGWEVRLGNYGDPASVPNHVHDAIRGQADLVLSYTHSWKKFPHLKDYCLASVETEAAFLEAESLGFKCFRIGASDSTLKLKREVCCMNKTKGLTCKECRLCQAGKGPHITIPVHGRGFVVKEFNRRFG